MWNVLVSLMASDRTDEARDPTVAATDDAATSPRGTTLSSCGFRRVPAAIDEKKSVPPAVLLASSLSKRLCSVISVASVRLVVSEVILISDGVASGLLSSVAGTSSPLAIFAFSCSGSAKVTVGTRSAGNCLMASRT